MSSLAPHPLVRAMSASHMSVVDLTRDIVDDDVVPKDFVASKPAPPAAPNPAPKPASKRAKAPAKPSAKPAAEHVQLFRMRYKRGTGFYSDPMQK